jgi:peptidoglycan/LPS O-acetylase OafA/YrhL
VPIRCVQRRNTRGAAKAAISHIPAKIVSRMRNKRIDILRFVAVLMVLLHHSTVSHFFQVWGWVGVDLFFVLSGFLISGLLFSEYKKRHAISFQRFFIRRGLKIYPAFYVFLLITGVAGHVVFHSVAPPTLYLNEMFFVMNYFGGVWTHTWSLGVEEHFYILLPIFLSILIRHSSDRNDPFRALPRACLVVGIACILMRAISSSVGAPNYDMLYMATHNRMDALSFGVLLGYLFHFRPHILEGFLQPTANRITIGLLSTGLLSTAYFIPRNSRFFSTFGYTFTYLGCAGVLLLSLYVQGLLPSAIAGVAGRLGSVFAYFGMFSYSIYLWQGQAETWLPGLAHLAAHVPYGEFAFSLTGSLVIGVSMSKLIEYPILHLRDRLFPAIQGAPTGSNADVSSISSRQPATTAAVL